jgi:hypothetical protein
MAINQTCSNLDDARCTLDDVGEAAKVILRTRWRVITDRYWYLVLHPDDVEAYPEIKRLVGELKMLEFQVCLSRFISRGSVYGVDLSLKPKWPFGV